MNVMAETLNKAGLGPARIYHCLYDECIAEGIDVSFNKFIKSQAAMALDCTNFLEHLNERLRKDSDLTFAICHDQDGRLWEKISYRQIMITHSWRCTRKWCSQCGLPRSRFRLDQLNGCRQFQIERWNPSQRDKELWHPWQQRSLNWLR